MWTSLYDIIYFTYGFHMFMFYNDINLTLQTFSHKKYINISKKFEFLRFSVLQALNYYISVINFQTNYFFIINLWMCQLKCEFMATNFP